MADPKPHDAAASAIAARWQQRVSDYVQRGRHLENVSAAKLKGLLETAYLDWARDPLSADAMRQAGDVTSEFQLRGVEPPMDVIANHVLSLSHEAIRSICALDEAAVRDLEETLSEDLQRGRRGHN